MPPARPGTTGGKQVLEISNLKFSYDDMKMCFDMRVEACSLVAVIGPSGAGKSTLLHLIAGFETPLSGTIAFAGRDITALAPGKRPVSIIFQDNNLFAHLDAQTNVMLGIAPDLKLDDAKRKQVATAFARVGLKGLEARLPGELSGGERQRVALARALVRDMPLLLLDEPFAALGPAMRNDMLELVRELQAERKMTVLLVTHQPDDARQIATHTAFLNNGRILLYEKTDKFFNVSRNRELKKYLGK